MNEYYEYYFEESSSIVVLSHKGRDFISRQLGKYRCKICNNSLILITKLEGSFVVCSGHIFDHSCGYYIDMSDLKKEPSVKENKNGKKTQNSRLSKRT